MNYLWDVLIKARHAGMPAKDISFIFDGYFSPYMELSLPDINAREAGAVVPVNPYYRFYDIFKDLFNADNNEDLAVRNALFDIVVHFLTEIDVLQGMDREKYYELFTEDDIRNGVFGNNCKEGFERFGKDEKDILIANTLKLYSSGNGLHYCKDTLRKVFRKVAVYVNNEAKDELLVFISDDRTEAKEMKLQWITDNFLPLRFRTRVYWKYHFGVTGIDESMKIDRIALY